MYYTLPLNFISDIQLWEYSEQITLQKKWEKKLVNLSSNLWYRSILYTGTSLPKQSKACRKGALYPFPFCFV